jgi:hypothetical protein
MFERIDALLDDLRAFAGDPTVAVIPFSFTSHDVGACLLQLAAGRTPASLGSSEPVAPDFETARRFLAYIVFDRRNNYFTLLCVDYNAPDEAIKDNYRRLIALVHPDASPIGFPADAASRVNLGYAVLSNTEARSSYAESIDRLPTVTDVVAKERHSESNGVHGGSRPLRPSPPRGLFAWIKRPRFGFGLLALATILILPVMVILANMANDTGSERLISGQERPEQKQAVPSAEATTSRPVRTTNSTSESNVAVLAENSASLTRPKVATRSDTLVQTSNVIIAATEATVTPKNTQEQGAIGLSTGAPVLTPRTAGVSSPTYVTLSLAPVPTRLLDQQEPTVAELEGRATRSTVPRMTAPVLLDAAPHNATGADATTQSAVKAQPVVLVQNLPTVSSRVIDARSRDSEDALLRFGSAYEQGSIDGVQALFASAMPGRSQMIADYQRVFSNTRQRNIRFLQLKHTVAGQRVNTVGQAVVNTIGADNKSSSQRVFLEIEVARVGNEVRIERMSNYALD